MADSEMNKAPVVAEKAGSYASSDDTEKALPRKLPFPVSFFAKLDRIFERLGGETAGIARIPEDQRFDDSFWDAATVWMAADLGIAAYGVGVLGITVFGLNIRDSMAVIICFVVLGTLPVSLLSTFGPTLGLRQIITSRFFFGSIGSRIAAFLNSLTCLGWASVNTVSAVNALYVVNHGGLPHWGGIILINLVVLAIAIFGYRAIHFYQRWAWIPNLIVFFVIAICLGQDDLMEWGSMGTGSTEAGKVLSFGGTVYGFAAGWGPYGSDYTVYKPKDSSKFKIFMWIMVWSCVGCIIPMLLGAFSAQRTLTSVAYNNMYTFGNVQGVNSSAYGDFSGPGGLLWMILVENSLHGFGQVCITVLSLSVIANNVPNVYTFSMCAQAVLPVFEKVPQYIWGCILTGVAIGVSIPAVHHFEKYLQDFMDILSYWLSIFYGICLAEFVFFRRSYDNFNIEAYNKFPRLPFGISAVFGGCAGVAGAVVVMNQTWYAGPIAKMIGEDYGDIGFELSFAFSFVGVVLTRWIEMWIYPDESYVYGGADAWWRFGGLLPESVFHVPKTPEWARKIDIRYGWARRHKVPGPTENSHVHSADTDFDGEYRSAKHVKNN